MANPPRVLAMIAIAGAITAAPAWGQRRQSESVFSLEADVLGGAVNYARARGPGSYWGLEAGVGGPLWNRMLLSGRHFAHEDGPSYQSRDGARDKELIEILHIAAFRRWVRSERWSGDVGARASMFLHYDSSDDDPGVPLFLGGYANLRWGNRRVKIGPTVLVGMFSEGSLAREFGVLFAPLTGRLSFGW